MIKSFKFKLYNNKRKNKKLLRQIEVASEVWNFITELQKTNYAENGTYIHKYEVQKIVTAEKENRPQWYTLGSQAIQEVADRHDKAFQRFFDWNKTRKGPKMLPPKFKSRKKYKSFTLKQAGWKYEGGNTIKIGKTLYRFHQSRDVEGKIKTVTIKRDSLNDYWIIFSCEVEDPEYTTQMTGKAVGVDFGLKTFLTISDCSEVIAPEPFKKNLSKVARANRQVSRKVKGSNNRKKAVKNYARLQRRIRNIREDYQWRLARWFVANYDFISFETLNMNAMKRLWGRKISDLSFSSFIQKIKYLAEKEGKIIQFVDRFYASSKTCFDCKDKVKDLNLKDREWNCPSCGSIHERDLNASFNILEEGIRLFEENSGRILSDIVPGIRPLYGGSHWKTIESHML